MGTATTKTQNGYDVHVDGEYVGFLRRPTDNVFASDTFRYWVAFMADGTRVGTGKTVAEGAHYIAMRHLQDGRLW